MASGRVKDGNVLWPDSAGNVVPAKSKLPLEI
jgi:hypothetical protein